MADTNITPAYKTVAFWANFVLTIAAVLAASGLVLPGLAVQAIGAVVTVLTALGFHAMAWKSDPTSSGQ